MSGITRKQACEQFEDSYDLYILGSLEATESKELGEHLLAGCAYCDLQLQHALSRTQAISQTVPLVNPPARLRRRLAGSIGATSTRRTSFFPWLIAVTATLLLTAFVFREYQLHRDEQQLARALASESARVSSMVQILAAPGTVELPLMDGKNQTLHGALYVHSKLGMAMVVDNLPAPPSGWTYESWVVPRNGVPNSIESFATDIHGRAITVLRGPVEVNRLSALLISMERVGSIASTPTTLVFTGGIKTAG